MSKHVHKPRYGTWPYLSIADLRFFLWGSEFSAEFRHGIYLTWLLRFGCVAEGTYITNLHRSDGVGAQLLHTLTVQAFCYAFGIPYAHTPLTKVSEKRRKFSREQCALWEARMKVGEGYPKVRELGLPVVRIGEYIKSPSLYAKPCVLSHVNGRVFLKKNPGAFNAAAQRLRAKHAVLIGNESRKLQVAIHVRRGDINPKIHPGRYTNNATIITTIKKISSVAQKCNRNMQITVFSQGKEEDFSDFKSEGVALKLDGDPLADFIEMQSADILVTAKSSFSYLAGLLNTHGIVICERWWYPLFPDWVLADAPEPVLLSQFQAKFGVKDPAH